MIDGITIIATTHCNGSASVPLMASHDPTVAFSVSPAIAHKRAALAVPLLLLAVLPGCFTGQLWDLGRNGAEQMTSERHVAQAVAAKLAPGATPSWHLQASGNATDEPTSYLRMSPRVHAREAVALMARPELFELRSNFVNGECQVSSGASMGGEATLKLTGTIVSRGWRSDIAEQDLPALVRARLKDPMAARLPQALRECGERLAAANLELLFPEASAMARITGYVFVDRANLPLPHPTDPAPLRDGAPSYKHRQPHLQQCTLIARLKDGNRERLLRIDPDAFWLLSTLTPHEGAAAHQSGWELNTDSSAAWEKVDAPANRRFDVDVCVRTYERPQPSVATRVLHVAWTPVAIVADLVITMPLLAVLMATGALDNVH